VVVFDCDEHSYLNVWIVSGPDHVAPGEEATFVITGKATNWSPTFQYVMFWGDTSTTTAKGHVSGDTDLMTHVWRYPGRYEVWATAQLLQHQEYGYLVNASAHRTVIVSSASDLLIDSARFYYQWRPIELAVWAHDPSGESLRLFAAWSDGYQETTGFQASPCRLSAAHHYASTVEAKVVFKVLNQNGLASAPDTLSGMVGPTGEVSSFYVGDYSGSPVVASDGTDEIIYLVGPDGFCGLRPDGKQYTYHGAFVGDPAFSSQAGHIYIGTEDGWLHAFTPTLQFAWEYPPTESVTNWEWGPTAVRGNTLYVPCSNDSVYCFTDNGATVTREAAFGAARVDAVVLDAAGSVYFGTDSGYLFKLTAGLNLVWRTCLQSSGLVYGPIVGADGTVYCLSDLGFVFAMDATDGRVKWAAQLPSSHLCAIVGSDAVYGTAAGGLYRLDTSSGATIWEKQLGSNELAAAPILVNGGYAYVQTEDDRLYCVSASTGDSVWVCNADVYLPRQPRIAGRRFSGSVSGPTVDGEGRVYLVGSEAVYKLGTYALLDASAPWPKWQHDLYNTGCVAGGR